MKRDVCEDKVVRDGRQGENGSVQAARETSITLDINERFDVRKILAGHAFLDEHHGDIGTGNAGNVRVIINRTTDLVFDEVERPARRATLLACHGNAADALCRALQQRINMRLPCRPDHHDVIGAVPSSHAHTANIVLKSTGSDFRRDDAIWLRVNVTKTSTPR
jgi:hypothetical protein